MDAVEGGVDVDELVFELGGNIISYHPHLDGSSLVYLYFHLFPYLELIK